MEKKINVKEAKVSKKITVYPKVELAFNHIIVSSYKKEVSGLILNPNSISDNRDPFLLDVQEVLAVGPFIKKENGIDLKVGDKVLLDFRKLQAKNAMVLSYNFTSKTGELISSVNEDNFKEQDTYSTLLITDREILLKIN